MRAQREGVGERYTEGRERREREREEEREGGEREVEGGERERRGGGGMRAERERGGEERYSKER